MSQPTFCTRIFDPGYIYLQAVRQTDEHPALRAMIDDIGYEHLTMVREEDFEKVYPTKTFYHHYKRNIAVIYIMNGTFNCQTFKNGIIDIAFDLIKDNQIAENFFKAAGNELTVIDFFNGKEIKPDYDTARAYAECVLNTEEELKQHNETISEYTGRLKSIKQECKVLYSTNPSVSYKKSINLHEGIVDKYIDYMDMNRNERENLMYLLTQEELVTNASRFIGDDLFC